ncbi:hypothetical protein CCUS01_15800 [Colletotrichum cuscutae]|uniref:Alpha/beta hydrolase fold-3 domain-containing protein n=1 Tax=Colletotrichum cuscutae TaxID=1209917 RepID=A0AAI9Y6Q8_9PEZI|nr:hypothetical protein CCUS01_15800 [Colletotrichum cuscutae]
MADSRTIHQPIHPSVRSKLDPEYVALHDSIIQYMEPSEAKPWDPASRSAPNPLAHTTQKLSPVGKQWDEDIPGEEIQVRVFVPEGNQPEGGWPCLVWLHGGGWVNGGLDSENGFLTHVSAVDDCLTGLKWLYDPSNASRLGINTSLVTIGGLSAGGNLAAILTMNLTLSPTPISPPPVSQLLICPVIDSTATPSTGWSATRHVPWLTPTRMGWYQDLYFARGEQDKKEWRASPCFAPRELLAKNPRTWLAVAGVDLLTTEGLAYAQLLRENGVEVESAVYEGATHSVLVLAGVHQISRKLVHDACAVLAKGFGTSYDPAAAPILSQEE